MHVFQTKKIQIYQLINQLLPSIIPVTFSCQLSESLEK